jgi:carboxyl-terminal processing protease
MEAQDKKKILIRSSLASVGAIALFVLLFFTLGPAVFGQSTPGNSSSERKYAQMFEQVFSYVSRNFVDEPDQQKLFEGAMKGLFDSLGDPHSLYLSDIDMMGLNDTTTGEFGGVGLYINKTDPSQASKSGDVREHYVEIVAPIEDTPAYKAGILAGDYITKIQGEDVTEFSMDKVLSVLRGKPGTKVKVTILRGSATSLDFELERAKIEVPTVKTAWIEPGIAYLRITQFNAHTKEKFDEAISGFEKKSYAKLIIDLRNNPGGLLEIVAKIGGRFFKDGVIVSTRSRVPGESSTYNAENEQTVPNSVQIIVLIDKGSASASEILSGALKDRKRALLVGETTYGKGSVQQIIPFDKTGFKLTMARYYTPSGVNIDKVGIKPDLEVKDPDLTDAELEIYRKLLNDKKLETWAKAHPDGSAASIAIFVKELQSSGIALNERLLTRLSRVEQWRAKNQNPPTIDLDYDIVLKKAVDLLNAGPLVLP